MQTGVSEGFMGSGEETDSTGACWNGVHRRKEDLHLDLGSGSTYDST
jgi:hypothetical protein